MEGGASWLWMGGRVEFGGGCAAYGRVNWHLEGDYRAIGGGHQACRGGGGGGGGGIYIWVKGWCLYPVVGVGEKGLRREETQPLS